MSTSHGENLARYAGTRLTFSDDLYIHSGVYSYELKGLLPIERIYEPSYSFTTGFKPDTI